jgi:uncharacterized RDD family membrane protein YckC
VTEGPPGGQPPYGQPPPGPEVPPGAAGAPPPPGGYAPAPAFAQPVDSFTGAELASWGSRVGAALLDTLVILGLVIVLVAPGIAVTVATDGGAVGIVLLVLGSVAYFVLLFLYAPYFMRRSGERNGQTLGKQWVGIRVIRDDGTPFDWGWGFLREVVVKVFALSFASSLASFVTFWLLGVGAIIPYMLDYLWPLWDDQNRALHDMVVKTHVVEA